ncbi:MAG TPA: hypothetical protein VJ997_09450 [Longimicrobiales bacterium]|nr:hypothetical protein [Longimicrobiales bacterium]
MMLLLATLAFTAPARIDPVPAALFCAVPDDVDPPAYYAVDLVTTKRLPGTGHAEGTGHVTFASSPFGVALAPDGSYLYDVAIQLHDMGKPDAGVLVAWATTTQVDQVQRLGALDESLSVRGQVTWNKFLVVVTLEPTDDAAATAWTGPIALRGMSRSGMMHTMAGHGPFQQELCAKYGYR